MICHPSDWRFVGTEILPWLVIERISSVLAKLGCRNLALSGGVDSTVMLAVMVRAFGKSNIACYNMASSKNHPDYVYSEVAARHFGIDLIHWIPDGPLEMLGGDLEGDANVRGFFRWVALHIDSIITCDGVDEFMGGYYNHMSSPTEATYLDCMRRLRIEQLLPLDRNSGEVKVVLPYLDHSVIELLAQIPYSEKFDSTERKKFMNRMARELSVPEEIIVRHKYGFIDAMRIKKSTGG